MAIIDAALIAACKAQIDTEFGPIPAGLDNAVIEEYRMKLARCIARAAQYVRDNGHIPFPIAVQVDTSTGIGATTAKGDIE